MEYGSFDILQDDDVRQGLKKHSNWPTYPQLYVKGELIGGLDIVKVCMCVYVCVHVCLCIWIAVIRQWRESILKTRYFQRQGKKYSSSFSFPLPVHC